MLMRGGGRSGIQIIFKYDLKGILRSKIKIPTSLGMTRTDGIAFDKEGTVFIGDSQGPIYSGYSLYRIPWKSPSSK